VPDSCELCGRNTVPLTEHHLIPKARHNKKVKRDLGVDRNKTATLCTACHRQVHALFTEKELERKYFTIALLKADERVINWIEWIRKRPTWA